MKIEEFCKKLQETLAGLPAGDVRVEASAKFVSLAFSVKQDEVAMFLLDQEAETLHFIWPPRLVKSGSIPLSASNPLAAQTARENRGLVNNAFAAIPHASIFELFRTDKEKPLPIQKIMSAPLSAEGTVRGVIQVSRKGETAADAGKDFTANDLILLQSIAAIIAAHV